MIPRYLQNGGREVILCNVIPCAERCGVHFVAGKRVKYSVHYLKGLCNVMEVIGGLKAIDSA